MSDEQPAIASTQKSSHRRMTSSLRFRGQMIRTPPFGCQSGIKEALYRMCHLPVPEQGRWLGQVLRGYFAYHAVPTNSRRITSFHHHVLWHWRRALARRSQKAAVPWRRMGLIVARWLPPARVRHPWPQQRFIVQHPRWEPSALAAHARICPGGAG